MHVKSKLKPPSVHLYSKPIYQGINLQHSHSFNKRGALSLYFKKASLKALQYSQINWKIKILRKITL